MKRKRLPPPAPPCTDPLCSCRRPPPAYPRETLPCGDYVNAWDAGWSLTFPPLAGGKDTNAGGES